MRWSATFGTFRGMGGIPKGRIELIGYRYSASLLTPAGLAYSHPAASFVSLPAGGIRPNSLLRVRQGGAYANYICDANGRTAFGVGSTSSSTDRADFVTELVRTPSAALPLAEAAYLRILKTDGTATFYHLETGAFAACISSQNSLLTAEEAAQYLDIVREQNGTIRQIWNYWDGLADIVAAENGYIVALYLPNQITGQNPASGLYTTSGTPFKTYAIGGDPAASSLTVTETDHTLPASMPPYTTEWTETDRLWNITRGTGDTAVSTTRTRETSPLAGTYRIVTTVSKGGAAASVVAENYISSPSANSSSAAPKATAARRPSPPPTPTTAPAAASAPPARSREKPAPSTTHTAAPPSSPSRGQAAKTGSSTPPTAATAPHGPTNPRKSTPPSSTRAASPASTSAKHTPTAKQTPSNASKNAARPTASPASKSPKHGRATPKTSMPAAASA